MLGIFRLSMWSALTLCSTWAILCSFLPAAALKPSSLEPLSGFVVTACPWFSPAGDQEGHLLPCPPSPIVTPLL